MVCKNISTQIEYRYTFIENGNVRLVDKDSNEILINKDTGEKLDNIEKIKDPITGRIKLIDKNNGEEIKGIEIEKKMTIGKNQY